MPQEYKKYWIGRCTDTGATTNLVIGELYLLKDKRGQQEHYYVSKHISNSDSFIGAYRSTYFEVLEDVTNAIKSMPYQSGIQEHDMWVGIVKMVSRERGMTILEAQEKLLAEGKLKAPVVDEFGNPLKKWRQLDDSTETDYGMVEDALPESMTADKTTTIMKRGTAASDTFEFETTDADLSKKLEETPKQFLKAEDLAEAFPEFVVTDVKVSYGGEKNYELPKEETLGAEKPKKPQAAGVTTGRMKTDKPNKASTPKTSEKPKFVQKGLFG
jgi:hypothetical protein